MIAENLQEIVNKLQTNNWVNKSIGYYKSGSKIKDIKGFELFIRETNFDNFLENMKNSKSANQHKTRVSDKGSTFSMENSKEKVKPEKNTPKGSNIDNFSGKLSNPKSANQHKIRISGMGSGFPMGTPKAVATPDFVSDANIDPTATLPRLADFDSYPSLVAARPDKPCILIGYDSEWENCSDGGRDMLSWQFAVVWGVRLIEICFIKTGTADLSFDVAMGCILDYLSVGSVDVRKIRRYMYCTGWDNDKPVVVVTDDVNVARSNCKYVYRGADGDVDGWCHKLIDDMPDRFVSRGNRDWAWFHTFLDFKSVDSVKICLLCHTGLVDISGFDKSDYILRHLTSVQGGLVSLQPLRLGVKSLQSVNNPSYYPVSLTVADTMCHAPAGHKKLENLGNTVGIPKIDVATSIKSHMLQFLIDNPIYYMEYASRDSVVTLLYCSALYGYNNTPPVTITSATAVVMKGAIMDYMGINRNDNDGFNRKYRGLEKISHGKVKLTDRPGYLESSSLEPISDKVHNIQYYASQAYHGGYNSCSEVGYFPMETYDYDLQNAYPTAMCLVPDIDWNNPIKFQIQNRDMVISDFLLFGGVFNPLIPFVCYCRFEFPPSVKYPCIPVNVDGVPVYPLSSDGLNGVYVAGPYIYLALRLGAKVFCENGYFLNTLITDELQESRSLAHAVLQLVQDRNRAKAECRGKSGEKSLEELILKTMVNSGYGKIAQNVVEKQTWTAFRDVMDSLGCSAITNPFSAMMITSIVQCELLAAQNQIHDLGFMTCSVTTDGFISDCPFDVLKQIDLYGFRQFMTQARLFLTGDDPELWEIKHHQNDLINFTTRGNVSLLDHGVCAHNSATSGYDSDSYNDRLWLMTQVLSRTGPITCYDEKWAGFKDIVQGKTDFKITPVTRQLHMDFDLKRKPDRDTFVTDYPVVDGVKYEIAHFDTVPYTDIAEFRLYRRKKKLCDCLRTIDEWDMFFIKVDTNACGASIKDLDWSILMSIIMGYRAGLWDIPALNNKTVVEKCDWINKHNNSKKQFNKNDWKNARRPERQVNMLPKSYLTDKLEEMQNDIS